MAVDRSTTALLCSAVLVLAGLHSGWLAEAGGAASTRQPPTEHPGREVFVVLRRIQEMPYVMFVNDLKSRV